MKNRPMLHIKAEDDADYILTTIMRRSRCSVLIYDELVKALTKIANGEPLAPKPKRNAPK